MPSLVYIAEDSQNVSYPFGRDAFEVGRREDAHLQLPGEQISVEHASIIFEEGQYVLRDHGSENGSYLNGERVSRAALNHNDIIRFGEYRFRVNLAAPAELSGGNNSNMETSRIDLPPELTRGTRSLPEVRGTRGIPDVRRVVEMRPHALKSAETSQIEPAGLPKVRTRSGSLESAIVRKTGGQKVSPSASLEIEQPLPAWIWFLAGVVTTLVVIAVVLRLMKVW